MSENKLSSEELNTPSREMTEEEMLLRNDVLTRIEKTLSKIRPYIQADGGDVQLVDYADGVVYVSMLGACAGCMAIDTTLNDGIQAILIDEVPEVKKVQMIPAVPYGYY